MLSQVLPDTSVIPTYRAALPVSALPRVRSAHVRPTHSSYNLARNDFNATSMRWPAKYTDDEDIVYYMFFFFLIRSLTRGRELFFILYLKISFCLRLRITDVNIHDHTTWKRAPTQRKKNSARTLIHSSRRMRQAYTTLYVPKTRTNV